MAKAKRSFALKAYNFWEVVRNIKILTEKSEIQKYFALFFRKFWPKTGKKTVKKPIKTDSVSVPEILRVGFCRVEKNR